MGILFAPQSLSMVRGTRWEHDVMLVDEVTGDPIDLTGIIGITMRVRDDVNGPILLELSMANGRLVVVNAAGGILGIRVTSIATRDLPEADNYKAKYVYDAVIERTTAEYEPGFSGKLTVNPQITRPYGVT